MALLGLDVPIITTLTLLASADSSVVTQDICPAQLQPPQIEVTVTESNTRFDNDKSRTELTELTRITPDFSPYAGHMHGGQGKPQVGGLMNGAMQVRHKVYFDQNSYSYLDKACVWVEKVEIDIRIDPTIYIAREYRENPCWHAAIFTHEKKHLDVDRQLAAEYSPYLESALKFSLMERADYASAPLAVEDISYFRTAKDRDIAQILDALFEGMATERAKRQAFIDSAGEYRKVNRSCKPLPQDRIALDPADQRNWIGRAQ